MTFVWILLLTLVSSVLPAQAAFEPPGSQLVVDCGLNTATCTGQVIRGTFMDWNATIYGNPGTIISDASAQVSPPNVLDSALIYPNTTGGAWLAWYNSTQTRDIYVRARVKINAGYTCSLTSSTKLMFLRNYENAGSSPITNGVFNFRDCGDVRTLVWQHNTGGLNNSHICGGDATGAICDPNVGPGQFTRGQWFDFEACTSASTTTTSRDGVVWWAVNGVMAGKYTTVNYGAGSANEWAFNQTWDGPGGLNGKGFTADAHVYLDHVRITVHPGGGCLAIANGVPGGGTAPPPPPPLPPNMPTNLRVQ